MQATKTLPLTITDSNTTVISGQYVFEELHVHEGHTLILAPGAELIRMDVPPANPAHGDGGIVVHGKLIAVRGPNDPPILIRSENPNGYRGHLMMHGQAEIDGVEFRDFGRTLNTPISATNPIGRYSVHWHLAGEASRGSYIKNCLIHDTGIKSRHGIVVHGSNGVTVQGNTIRNKSGSGVYIENGTELDNVIEGNIIEDIVGSGLRSDGRNIASGDNGHEGNGVWLRTPANRVRNNIVRRASCGFRWFMMYAPAVAQSAPIMEFSGNRAEFCSLGAEYWWLGGYLGDLSTGLSIIDNFTVTDSVGTSGAGVYGYQGGDILIRGSRFERCRSGFDAGDYLQRRIRVENCDFVSCTFGVVPSTVTNETMLIDNCRFSGSVTTDILIRTLFHSNNGSNCPPRKLVLRNCTLGSATKIKMWYWGGGQNNWVQNDELFVEGPENYQVFYSEQAATFIVPQTTAQEPGCPVAGLTNAQAWADYGVATAGAVLPANATTKTGIIGKVA